LNVLLNNNREGKTCIYVDTHACTHTEKERERERENIAFILLLIALGHSSLKRKTCHIKKYTVTYLIQI